MSPYNWDYMIIQEIKIDGNDLIIISEDYSSTVMYYLTNMYMPVMSKDQIENTTRFACCDHTDKKPVKTLANLLIWDYIPILINSVPVLIAGFF